MSHPTSASPASPIAAAVPTSPQPWDVNETGLCIGTYVDVPEVGMYATITRINNETIWLVYDDGQMGCVALADVYLVFEGENHYDETLKDQPAPTVYEVTVEHADEPTMNTRHYEVGAEGLPSYLKPILEAPDFHRIQYSIGLTRKTIKKVE